MNLKERQARQKGIGGSDVAAICGWNPWSTPIDIYYSKIVPIPDDDIDTTNERCKTGNIAEPFIIKRYEEMKGVKVKTDMPLLRHPKYPFLLGNVDGFVEAENVIVECKTVGSYADQWKGEMPIYYKTQCAHYAMILDAKRVDLIAQFDRQEFKIFVYERDSYFEGEIRNKCIDFWENHVLKKKPPQAIQLKDFAHVSYKKESICEADDNMLGTIANYKAALQRQKQCFREVETYKVSIIDYMKDNDTLVDKDGNVIATYKSRVQKRLDTKALKDNEAEIYNKYSKDNSYRILKMQEANHEHHDHR